MLKHLKYIIAIIALLVSVQPVLAFESKSIVKIDAPYGTLYHGTFDNLVLDFSLVVTRTDSLKAVSLKNLGTADNLNQISYLTLWADSGPVGFQGMGIDRNLGNFKYASQNWYLDNLNERISVSQRFFVSAELFSYIAKSATLQLQIPKLVDSNVNGSYNLTDLGIFMDSGDNGPVDTALNNSNTQVISTTSSDMIGPKIAVQNLSNGQIINNNHYLIQGMIRDQGNSEIKDLTISLDGLEAIVTDFDTTRYSWQYDWQNITDGAHTLKVLAHDLAGNLGQTQEISLTVANQPLALENSSVTINKSFIKNDGLDKALVTVKLLDQNKLPIANRQLRLEGGDVIVASPKITDSTGQAIFEVRSTVLGQKTLTVQTDDFIFPSVNLLVNLSGADINSGDLVKSSTPAVYYFGANGKRYVFPNQAIYASWYSDFKNIKTITDSQLAGLAIGGNVTYKPGSRLIKIATDPKVYAVDLGGTLRWLKTEAVAKSLYGSTWALKIVDVPDTYFMDYKMGLEIAAAGDFDLAKARAVLGINEDKGF